MSGDDERQLRGVDDASDADRNDEELQFAANNLVQEIASGNTRRALNAIRNRIGQELYIADGKDVAQLSLALVKVLDAIDKVPAPNEADPVNEIAARRERRRREAGLDEAAGQ